MDPSRIPVIYRSATLRHVTPAEAGYAGVGFNLVGGGTIRLKLSVVDLHKLALLTSHMSACHSPGSSGIPSDDESSN